MIAALVLGADHDRGGPARHRPRRRGRPGGACNDSSTRAWSCASDDGTLHLLGEAFGSRRGPRRSACPVARARRRARERRPGAAGVRPRRPAHVDPDRAASALVVLDWLAQRFDPGRRYSGGDRQPDHLGGASRHRGAPPLSRRRGHPRSRARRVLAQRWHVRPGVEARHYGARHVTGTRRSQRPSARERDHAQQARAPELDVVPVGRGVVRGARRGRPRQRLVGRRADRRRARILLRSRPPRPGHPAEHARISASRGSRCGRCRT